MSQIGIPRALYYFQYNRLWQTFLGELGFQVVISPETNREILNMGLLSSVDGFCLPMKIYMGHVQYLVKNGIDRIFVPQIISVRKKEYICPNFMGLPDLIAQSVPSDIEIISPTVDGRKGRKKLIGDYLSFGRIFAPLERVKFAWEKAEQAQAEYDLFCENITSIMAQKINLLFLGPCYLTEDPFLNGDLINELDSLGVHVITQKQMNPEAIMEKQSLINKPLFWSGAKESFDTLNLYLDKIDGAVIVSPFGCGAQSLVNVLLNKCLQEHGIPNLELYLDEHGSSVGIQTRIEAFIDLLERKHYHENNLSTSG